MEKLSIILIFNLFIKYSKIIIFKIENQIKLFSYIREILNLLLNFN